MSLSIKIKGVGVYIPEKVVKNDFFIEHFKKEENGCVDVEGLMKSLGRDERHFAERGESSLSMGYEASLDVLDKTNTGVKDLDMIVFVSDTPEYTSPTNALILNNKLGADNAHIVFDMNCNCTGMLVALDNVSRFMKTNKSVKKALVVGSLYASSVVRWNDSISYPCFGDAGTAIILSSSDEESVGILSSEYLTDSRFYNNIRIPACGNSNALLSKQHKYYRRLEWLPFDTSWFSESWYKMVLNIFKENNITDDDIAYYLFSQFSNSENIKTLDKLGVTDKSKYIFNGDRYGYTGCSSPILALSEIWNKAKDMNGKYLILISVAAGISMSAILYKL